MSRPIFLCAISNVSSGSCSEDCKFCTQSAHYNTDIENYKFKSIDKILIEAKKAQESGVLGFCLVTAGKGLNDKTLEYISSTAMQIKSVLPNLNLIACNGTATLEQLKELKKAGIDSYNHNLETAKSYYPDICTTHSWDERYETCQNVKEAGLKLCTGGIFGMGESLEQRNELIEAILFLEPESVPVNFFHPNPALPLTKNSIEIEEGLNLISKLREHSQKMRIMVAGGRETFFKKQQEKIFAAGANAIVLGDYLTTSGNTPSSDLKMLKSMNLEIATSCHD